MKNLKDNKIIARFMGMEEHPSTGEFTMDVDKPLPYRNYISASELIYDSNWEWLMLVIERISGMRDIYAQDKMEITNAISADISKAYKAVVDLIKIINAKADKKSNSFIKLSKLDESQIKSVYSTLMANKEVIFIITLEEMQMNYIDSEFPCIHYDESEWCRMIDDDGKKELTYNEFLNMFEIKIDYSK